MHAFNLNLFQGYETVNTEDIPNLKDSSFSPDVSMIKWLCCIMRVAMVVLPLHDSLMWHKEHVTGCVKRCLQFIIILHLHYTSAIVTNF